jgi:hypothetical protein
MSGPWGFARDFQSSILVGSLARERSTTGADEGALADDVQVRPPPGGDLGCYWMRKHGLGASGLQATPFFFLVREQRCTTGLFNVRSNRPVFLRTTILQPSRPLAILLVEMVCTYHVRLTDRTPPSQSPHPHPSNHVTKCKKKTQGNQIPSRLTCARCVRPGHGLNPQVQMDPR